MATLRRRNGKWQVQVRKTGASPLTKTFTLKKDAEAWARGAEIAHERGDPLLAAKHVTKITLEALLDKYERKVTPTKRSAHVERYRIGLIRRYPIVKQFVCEITPEQIGVYRDERLKSVSSETVRQDLVLIRQVIEVARREWGLVLLRNPVDDVRKPKPAKARSRRLVAGEFLALVAEIPLVKNPVIREVVFFAIFSGMRRGEILRIEWRHIDWQRRVLFIPVTKNGHSRTIPLSGEAIDVLERSKPEVPIAGLAFPVSANAVRLAWEHLRVRAKLHDLRFHDLRREAISRFFEAGLTVPEVALISGHRDIRQLSRYSTFEAENIARKLI